MLLCRVPISVYMPPKRAHAIRLAQHSTVTGLQVCCTKPNPRFVSILKMKSIHVDRAGLEHALSKFFLRWSSKRLNDRFL